MQMDRVIDNAQGSGLATGAGSFNFQGSAPRLGWNLINIFWYIFKSKI